MDPQCLNCCSGFSPQSAPSSWGCSFLLLSAASGTTPETSLASHRVRSQSVSWFHSIYASHIIHFSSPPSHTAENVYVKMFTNSPSLVCMDLSLSQEEIIDPKYSWTGPDGRNLEGERLSAAHAGFPLFSHCLSHCFQSTHSEGCSGVETAPGGGAGNQGKRGRKPTQLSLRGEKLSANS